MTPKQLLALACLAAVMPMMAMAMGDVQLMEILEMDEQFSMWKKQYGKEYSPREDMQRRHLFYKNLLEIQEHNAKYPTEVSYVRGLNQFSDMTLEEYRSYNKLQTRNLTFPQICNTFLAPLNAKLPETVDWRTKGYVTPVKDQGGCGSCWAFSTTGAVEGQHFRKTGKLLSLSEQQLMDCSRPEGNHGCGGGLMDNAYKYISKHSHGLETEEDYPYTANDTDSLDPCRATASKEKAPITGCVDITSGSEEALKQAVATVGPVSVAIDAGTLFSYKGGVYKEPNCSSTGLNHGVLVVGYGTYQGEDYWLVKNSWGTGWGMNGYVMMARNNNNMCGIATYANYPTV